MKLMLISLGVSKILCARMHNMKQQHTTFELTHPQKRILFNELLYPDLQMSNVGLMLKFREHIDYAAFNAAINHVLKKYAGLRTRIKYKNNTGSEFVQYVSGYQKIAVAQINYKKIDKLENFIRKEQAKKFALLDADLFYFAFIEFNPKETGFYLKLHHAIFDGVSANILINEIVSFCQHSNQNDLAARKVTSYVKFIEAEQEYLQSEKCKLDTRYWMDKYAAIPDNYVWVTKNVKHSSLKVERKYYQLADDLFQQIKCYQAEKSCSLFIIFAAAFTVYFNKIKGLNDVVIGTAVHNRASAAFKEIIGMFVSTLPAHIHVEPDYSFNTLLAKIQQNLKQDMRHQKYPYDLLVQNLRAEKKLTDKLLTISLTENIYAFSKEVTLLEHFFADYSTDAVTIFLNPRDRIRNGILEIAFDYQSELLSEQDIAEFFYRVELILQNLLTAPDLALKKIESVSPEEKLKLICEYNQTTRPFSYKTIHELFEEQVNKTPQNIALVFDGSQLTYQELNAKANQLAKYLRTNYQHTTNKEFKPNTLIALYLNRSLEMIVAILAIIKAGGTYVPIDPTYPNDRINYILQDTKAKLVITQASLQNQLQSLTTEKPQIIAIDAALTRHELKHLTTTDLTPNSSSTDLAYVIYTSGTTGKPKGVMVAHSSVINLLEDFQDRKPLAAAYRAGFWTSMCFDVSVYEIFSALLAGCALHIFTEEMRLDPDLLFKHIQQYNINALYLPPHLIPELHHRICHRREELHFWRLLVGVEPIAAKLLSEICQNNKDLKIINGYGPTEATICATLFDVTADTAGRKNTPIGKAVNNNKVYILNPYLQPVPADVIGEIYLGGAGLARGYLNRPEITQEKFIPNLFATAADVANGYIKLYKTGDLAKWLPDGNIEYVGRNDSQVKIRGFRIELEEIESAIAQIPGIKQVIVQAKEKITENGSNKYLVAYYIKNSQAQVTQETICEQLRQILPEYMIPSACIELKSFPITINGKLDRNALPNPEFTNHDSYRAPTNEHEQKLCDIWQKVLGMDHIGINDNFFSVGGNSIKSVEIIMELKKSGYTVKLADFFAGLTVATIAPKMRKLKKVKMLAQQTDCAEEYAHLITKNITDIFPASQMQRLIIKDYLRSQEGVYHPVQCFGLKGVKLGKAEIAQILISTIQNMDAFKTYFLLENSDECLQAIREKIEFIPEFFSLNKNQNFDQLLEEIIKKDRATRFDVYDPKMLPIRIKVIFTKSDRLLLYISMHHAFMDGWSEIIFINYLFANLLGDKQLNCTLESPVSSSFKQYCLTEPQFSNNEKTRHFWQSLLYKNAALKIPKLTNTNREHNSAGHIQVRLTKEFSCFMEQLMKSKQISLKALFLYPLYRVMSRHFSQTNLTIGVVTNTRQSDLDAPTTSVGMFWNIVPILFNASDSDSKLQRLLNQIDSNYSRYPLRQIMTDLNNEDLFAITFKYLHFQQLTQNKNMIYLYKAIDLYAYPLNFAILKNETTKSFYITVDFMQEKFTTAMVNGLINSYAEELQHCYLPAQNANNVIDTSNHEIPL